VGTVKDATRAASVSTATSSAAEGRALVALSLLVEGTKKTSSRLWSELVVTKTNPNLTAGKLESVHLGKRVFSVVWIDKSGQLLAWTMVSLV
jgi:hypothetical protein